ncbi:MAG: hypothetical protein WBM45_02360 [Woeseiaceae bacterium]
MGKVDTRRLSDWLEIVAASGVILSLLFVGFEIRQNTAIARGQARQDLAQLNQEWLVLLSQDTEFEALWNDAFGLTPRKLSPDEERRAQYIMTIHLRRLENVYLQYREGLVEKSALRNYGFQNIEMFRRPEFERYWVDTGWRAGFDAEFADFLDSVRTAAREGDTHD